MSDVDPKLVAAIRHKTRLDQTLYEAVLRKFDADRKKFPVSDWERREFRALQRVIGGLCRLDPSQRWCRWYGQIDLEYEKKIKSSTLPPDEEHFL